MPIGRLIVAGEVGGADRDVGGAGHYLVFLQDGLPGVGLVSLVIMVMILLACLVLALMVGLVGARV
jgi:hypothetical protein